jgi:hypothetical protein
MTAADALYVALAESLGGDLLTDDHQLSLLSDLATTARERDAVVRSGCARLGRRRAERTGASAAC